MTQQHFTPDEIINKVRVTRHRLQTALDAFYKLDLSADRVPLEASVMDIAVPIRVLMHHYMPPPPSNKPPSICLLHQLDADYGQKPIHFQPLLVQATPAPPPPFPLPPGVMVARVAIPLNVSLSANKTAFTRYKKGTNPQAVVSLIEWWNNPCWDSGTNKVSNRDLVLSMANKEGGAHVDGDTSAKYKAAKDQGHIIIGGTKISQVARLGSLVGIAGDELLEYLEINYPSV